MDFNKSAALDQVLKKVERIPPLPAVAMKSLRLMNNPNFNMKELAEILATDQAIASTLLRWANSAYYGLKYPITTIHQAITYLGENTVRSLVLTASLNTYMNRPLPGYYLDRGELWKHSVGVAMVSRLIMKKHGEVNLVIEEAYTAGLLADIGKMAFEIVLRDVVLNDEALQQMPFHKLESNYFGVNHAELGAEMARRWEFPEGLQLAITYHHAPSECKVNSLLPSTVHLADALVTMLGIGIGRDGLQYSIDPFVFPKLGIPEDKLDSLLEEVLPLASQIPELMKA